MTLPLFSAADDPGPSFAELLRRTGTAARNLGSETSGLQISHGTTVVVPLFAGFDVRRRSGRLFQYDVTGGRYEETNFATTGSGSLHAGTVIKLGYRERLVREDAIDLLISALFNAADEDSATGGPDLVRGIYPTMATITDAGFEKLADEEIADRFRQLVDRLSTPESASQMGSAPQMKGGEPE